ncbi:MAG: S8 family serine peptidase, partial [Defluviitaleaceae bacterium]|nr:S8 family serine peptidase [Defluviitaleaceae bacterium]
MRIFRRFLVAVLVAVLVLPYLIMPTHGLLAMEGTVFEEDYLEIGGIGARVSMSVSGDVWNGGYADITIFLDSNPGMFGFVVDLLFDDTKLVPVSIFGGNLRDFQVVSSPVDGGIYHGRLKFLAHGAELSNETGAIATARFRVIDDIYWEIPISIESLDAVVDDGFGGIIELSVSAHGEALPQQGIQAFEQASVVGLLGFRFGDANGDGRVTSADGTVIARYLVGHDVAINRRGADVNADGVISDDDRNFLAGALVGRYPRLGPPPNSLTIVPYCSLGFPVYRAEIELFVDGVRTVHQTQTGVIAIRDIPDGSSVQFNVTSEYGGFSSAEIGSFNYYFDGVQVVTLEEEEPVSMPYIRVLTEFPSGTVHLPFMDIEYMVAPGDGADILTVSYSINGRHHNYIYWHGNAVLGQARVFITPGRNELAFTVRDSRGREAVYVVENVPYFQSGLSAGRAPIEYNRPSVRHEGEYFVNNRIRLGAFVQNNPASHEEIVEIINSMGGVIIGYSRTVSCFTVQVPEDDEAGLLALGESFIELFPHIFDFSGISGGFIDPRDAFACECCIFRDDLVNAFGEPLEPWTREERRAIIEARLAELAEGGDSDSFQESFRASRISLPPVQLPPAESPGGSSFHCPRTSVFSRFYQTAPTNDPFWHSSNPHYQWGLRDSFLSHAWDFSGYQERQNIKVGIIDQPVRHTHEDLNIPSANTSSVVLPISDFHGTMVMGIIGAEHDNGRGLAGGINIARENLFAYDIRRGNFYYGLRWNVERGTRVVNISMILSRDSRNDILRQMQNLLYVGYDFIIVQAAGNASADTNRDNSGSIAYGASQELRDRIITVGNLAPRPSEGECDDDWTRIHYSSNWGALVDVFAPGHNTYSAFSRYPWYMLNGGTSSAAPFVSSLAALIWDEHPDFSGTQVKQIIVDSAQGEYGETVVDTRRTQGGTYHAINALAAMKLAYRATPEHISGRFVGRVVSAAPYSNAYFPVRNAEVRIYRIEREVNRREWYRRVVETDAQGFFSAKNLFPGNYEFFVYAPRYVQVDVPFIHIPAGVTTQRVTLPMVAQTQVATGNVGGTLVMATPQPEDFAVSNFTSLSDTVTIPFNGRATMQFIRGIYFIEPYMLECAEWMEFLDFNVVKTVEVTDGHFHAQLPPGNYTVIVSGAVIYTEIAHVISHWDGDDYWLKQDINIRINPNLNVIWGTDGDDEIIVASTNRRSYFVFPLGGNDVITVNGSGNNTIYATIGNNEILITGSGYNTVYGSLNGNDTIRTESSSSRSRIDPGLGNNTIVAGTGHDTFVIGRGYGFNRITANSSSSISRDRLVLKDGIRPDEVYFVRDGNNLEIYIWEKPAIMAFGMSTIHLLPMELVCENAIEEFREIFENITNRITFVDFFRATRHRIIDITFDD